ncbi:MAG: DegT/DnrJ/EryC1/StrS family aminotransferase [Proteobacteria bacterium]|nr:DegT/DnrJ/EryC1/StrS family aminotransferase [Pseudomonadota bacterium]
MAVPLLDLKGQYASIKGEIDAAIAGVAESQYFINGPQLKAFQEEAQAFLGASHAIGCASGSDALMLALWALGIGPGDEVITTPFTFFATAGAISRLGATPVFVDIEPGTFNIDPDGIEAAIGPKTVGILPVHLYGVSADMDRIGAIAKKHDLFVVEDAAQSIGATWNGAQTGTMGDAGCFSFFPSKNLGAWGDGGMVTSMNAELASTVSKLAKHGNFPRKYMHQMVGCNSRLDALQAAILRVKLGHLADWCEARRARAATYKALVADRGLADRVTFQEVPDPAVPVYHQCVVRVPSRDDVAAFFKERGVGHAVYYPLCLHLQECYAPLEYAVGSMPVAEQATEEVLALPIYPELTEAQQAEVIDTLAEALG